MYDRGHKRAITVAAAGAFIAFLDTTIVNIAFPDISESFAPASRGALSWVLDGYFVVIAALLVPAGGLADRFGRKRIFLQGVALFTFASFLCAVAPTLSLLVAARVIQGVGAAMVVPASLALMLTLFPADRRAGSVAAWGGSAALAAAIGPTLGGALTEFADWRWVFLVNLPLGAFLLLAGRSVPESKVEGARLPDLLGGVLLAFCLALLTLGIVEGNDWGWSSLTVLGIFAASAVLFTATYLRGRKHPRPVLQPELFRLPTFRDGNIGTMLFAAAFFSIVLGNVLYLTSIWGYDLLKAALAILPAPIGTVLVARPAGRIADRFGYRSVILPGAAMLAGGIMILRSAGAEPDWVGTWLPAATLTGVGTGLAFPTLGAAAVRDVPDRLFATASAINAAFRQIGAVLGTALLVAILGDPETLDQALAAADRAYLVAAVVGLSSGLFALKLGRAPALADEAAQPGEVDPAARPGGAKAETVGAGDARTEAVEPSAP